MATVLLIQVTTACEFVNIAYIAGKPVREGECVEMPHSLKFKGRGQILAKLQRLLTTLTQLT